MPAISIPTNLPTAYYPDRYFTVDGVRQRVPAGIYTDHTSPLVEQLVYDLRDRRAEDRWTHFEIADRLQLGHWRVSYNVGRNLGRRRDGENGRDREQNLTYRSWNRQRSMTATPAPNPPGSRPDSSLATGRFGWECEFNAGQGMGYGEAATMRADIARTLQQQGINARTESYNHTTVAHWKVTTDATVTGGEIVSPILDGTTASLDTCRDVLRAVKQHGGTTRATVGMHVHHDATWAATAEQRSDIVNVLHWAERGLAAYVVQARIEPSAPCGAVLMSASEWRDTATDVLTISPQQASRGYHDSAGRTSRYRFFNICGPLAKYGSVEFRGLGGTLHAGKLRVWVRMGQALMELAKQGYNPSTVPATPNVLVDVLRDRELIGPRTARKFLAECERRGTINGV